MNTRICIICEREFKPCKPTSTTCSARCRNTWVSRQSAVKRANTLRGTGAGVTYTKFHGRHAHRIAAEEMLGRKLLPGEIVHHKDHNKKNNDHNNLVVMSQSEHCRIHFTKRKEVMPNV